MFNLDYAINEWRRKMAAAGIEAPSILDELESHLREEIDRQIRLNLTEERAFEVAIEHIGKAGKLYEEFDKVEDVTGGKGKALLRSWVPAVIPILVIYFITTVSWYSRKAQISSDEAGLALGALAVLVLLGWTGHRLAKFLPVISPKWFIGILVLLLCFPFSEAAYILVRFPVKSPVDLVHLQIAVLWMLSPMLGLAICFGRWRNRCATVNKRSCKYV